jgi:hypothetical protein
MRAGPKRKEVGIQASQTGVEAQDGLPLRKRNAVTGLTSSLTRVFFLLLQLKFQKMELLG